MINERPGSKFVALIFITFFLIGCTTIAKKYVKDEYGNMVEVEKMTCMGPKCSAEFETGGKISGEIPIPDIPVIF